MTSCRASAEPNSSTATGLSIRNTYYKYYLIIYINIVICTQSYQVQRVLRPGNRGISSGNELPEQRDPSEQLSVLLHADFA